MAAVRIDLLEFARDPFGELARARREGEVAEGEPFPAVVSHAGVRQVLGDRRFRPNFNDAIARFGVDSGAFFEWMRYSPLNTDGEEHRRFRALMARTFTPRSVEALRPFLAKAAHELIDGFAARGACEFMAEFADAYPSLGLCELIGVPLEDRDRFRAWANAIGFGFNPLELPAHRAEVDAALGELLDYAGRLLAERRREPRDDLVTRIAQAGETDGFPDRQLRGFVAGLVFAGHETTKNQLGWMLAVLAERPDAWERLAAEPDLAPRVVEELMRHRSAATSVLREATEPLAIGGRTFAPGEALLVSLWSANHDERVFGADTSLDLDAERREPHFAFGHGAHHCLGAALARAELQEALRALTARLPCPVVEEGAAWRPPVGINGPTRLPLRFSDARQ